jgi:hypothetical protein
LLLVASGMYASLRRAAIVEKQRGAVLVKSAPNQNIRVVTTLHQLEGRASVLFQVFGAF